METKNKKILISRTDKIGDLILSIPSFFMVRKMFPEGKISLLVRNYNKDIVANLPYIDKVICIDDYDEKKICDIVEKMELDIFIALFSDSKIAKIARKSKAKMRIGPISKFSSLFSYNCGLFQKRSRSIKNEAEYNLDLVKRIDKSKYEKNFEINNRLVLKEENTAQAKQFIADNKISEKKIILIHPFSGGSAKNILDTQYTEIIKEIISNFNDIEIIVSSSVEDAERGKKIVEDANSSRVRLFISKGSILNLAGLINFSDIFIGTSTGPTHIAGALDKNIIGIYPIKKTQSTLRWGVYGNSKVKYILPEGKVEEDYSTKQFLSYGDKDKKEIINAVRYFIGN